MQKNLKNVNHLPAGSRSLPGKFMSNTGKEKYLIDIVLLSWLVRPFLRTIHCDIFISKALPELLTEGVAICPHLLRHRRFRIRKYSETVSSLNLQAPHYENYPGLLSCQSRGRE